MQSACAWASISSEADDGACCVAQRRMADPPRDAMPSFHQGRLALFLCCCFQVCNSLHFSKAFETAAARRQAAFFSR